MFDLFICHSVYYCIVIKYILQNFSKFEKSLEGATSVSIFVHNVNRNFESFLSRGLNMMMINLDCAKNLLDMWVLMLQNQWKKNEKKNLYQFEKITIL